MQQIKPIRRSPELTPLSRDHHDGLLLCWKIRQGLSDNIETSRIATFVAHSFEEELAPHFTQEEIFVFSLLPDSDAMKKKALGEHDRLRAIYTSMKTTNADNTVLLKDFEQQLNDHIRFEERELFPYIEISADPGLFAVVGKKIEEMHTRQQTAVWHDEFWIKKKL